MSTIRDQKPRVLCIDDDKIWLAYLAESLKSDYEVVLKDSARAGLAELRNSSFDLVLLDLLMPQVDGLYALSLIRRRHPTLPVFIVTGLEDPEYIVKASEMVANAYFLKSSLADSATWLESINSAMLELPLPFPSK